MSYEVFARKYRPQTFNDLVGQDHVARTLKNAVEQNRLAHAYLFVGPRGTGKTSTARILAKALNCTAFPAPTATPCGICDNCKEIAAGNSFDVLEIDGASNNKVDEVRVLTDNVRYAPAKARFKIYIIDEVHMLTPGAFNALLKTLEEPPPHVKFIFATTEPQKVLPTIVSRCQRFDLHRIGTNLIAQHLQFIAGKEKITLAPLAAHAVARAAEGGMRDAESMLDQLVAFCGEKIEEPDVLSVFGLTSQQTVADFTFKILSGETAATLELLHSECENGKDMMKLMSDLIAYLRDLLVFKVKPDALSDDVSAEIRTAFESQAGLIETDRVLELIDQFAATEGRMKWAPNKKLHFEVAVIKAIQSLNQATLDDVISNLAAMRDGKETKVKAPLKSAPPRREAVAPAKSVARPVPAKADAPAVAEVVEPTPIDVEQVWRDAAPKITKARPMLKGWVAQAHALGVDGRTFQIGFPPDHRTAVDVMSSARNRELVESVLQEVSGRAFSVKFAVKEGLDSRADASDGEAVAQHPLIQEAVELFKGKIKS